VYRLEDLTYEYFQTYPVLRVSCAIFADIKIGERRALLINKGKLDRNVSVLTPVGGVMELTPRGMFELQNILEIGQSDFEKGLDMRFNLKSDKINDLISWLLMRKNRDDSPLRELKEELIQETNVLKESDFKGIDFGNPAYQTEIAETDRTGQVGKLTIRLVEIYPTFFTASTMQKLVGSASKPSALIRFVTDSEIRTGKTVIDQMEIRSISNTLLKPLKTIPLLLKN
jgi:hypothetical protein